MLKKHRRIRPIDESYILYKSDKPVFLDRFISNSKGRVVFATQHFEPGEFLLEYRGELLEAEEYRARNYSESENTYLS